MNSGEMPPENHRAWALFDRRVAWWYEGSSSESPALFHLTGGRFLGFTPEGNPQAADPHALSTPGTSSVFFRTNDESEAEDMWNRLLDWVRTGVLP